MHLRSFLLLATPLFLTLVGCGSSSDDGDTSATQTGNGGSGNGGSTSCSHEVTRCVDGKEQTSSCDPCASPNSVDCDMPDGHVSCGNGTCVMNGHTCGEGGQGGAGAGGSSGQGGAGAGGSSGQGGAGAGGKGGAGQGGTSQGGAGVGAGAGTGGTGGSGGTKSCAHDFVRCVDGKEQTESCDPCAGNVDCDMPDGHVSCGNGTCVPNGQACGTGGMGGAGGGSGSIEGSFDLLFVDVKAKEQISGSDPVSKGTKARVDIRKAADGVTYEALFTSSFLSPQGMAVAVESDKVTLSGQGLVQINFVNDTWQTLSFGRTPAGGLDGTMTGSGQEEISGGDVISTTDLTGSGTIGPDITTPSFASKPSSQGPTDALLPWDPLPLQISEGLDPAAVTKVITLSIDGGTIAAPLISFDPDPAGPLGWGGATRVEVRSPLWDSPVNTPGDSSFKLSVGAGLPDRVGNLAPAFEQSAKRLAVALGGKEHGFDSDTLDVTTWGTVTPLGGKSGSDPHCEKGGCVQLGPFDLGYCSKDVLGFAGRAPYGGESTLSVRYRLFVKGDAGVAPSIIGQSLVVSIYGNDGFVKGDSPGATSESLTDQGAQAGELRWATDWLTFDIPLPSDLKASELGFIVAGGTQPYCGFVPPAIKSQIFVDSVTIH